MIFRRFWLSPSASYSGGYSFEHFDSADEWDDGFEDDEDIAERERSARPAPTRAPQRAPQRAAHDSFDDGFDDDFDDEFAAPPPRQARPQPAQRTAPQQRPAPQRSAPQRSAPPAAARRAPERLAAQEPAQVVNEGFDGFDDGFDDDFEPAAQPIRRPAPQRQVQPRPMPRTAAPQGRPQPQPMPRTARPAPTRMQSDGFDDDFDSFDDGFDSFEEESAPVRRAVPNPAAAQRRPQPPQGARPVPQGARPAAQGEGRPMPPQGRPMPPQARAAQQGPNGAPIRRPAPGPNAQQRPTPQPQRNPNRPEGMPDFFAAYLEGTNTNADERRKSKRLNAARARRKKMFLIGSGVAASVAAVALLVGYLTIFRVSNPIVVQSAFAEMSNNNTYAMLKMSIDDEFSDKVLNVNLQGSTFSFKLSDYDFAYAIPGTEEVTYREVTSESGETINQKLTSDGALVCNQTKIEEFLAQVAETKGDPMKTWSYTIDEENSKMVVTAGTNGVGIDYDTFLNAVKSAIRSGEYGAINSELVTITAPAVDIDEIYSQVKCEAADARSTTNADGTIAYISHVVGKDFDVESARATIAQGGTSWDIPLTLTQPELDLKTLKAPTCPDLLSTLTTKFSANNKARNANIALAAEKINGLVLQPGEVFAFNSTVGERTAENGFSQATVYTEEGSDTGYGGGICQVSSTVYYACIKANLEIVERHNHGYTVAYMPVPGSDATVSWTWPELRIKNDKEYPIRLDLTCENNQLTCNVYGTSDGYSADFDYVVSDYVGYKTIYKKPQAGKSNTSGQQGYTVTTYRRVYKDGKLISRKEEAVSTYRPLNAVVYTDNLPAGKKYG